MRCSKRAFIKAGGLAAVGAYVSPAARAAAAGAGGQADALMTHFGVSERDLRNVLSAALERGGDYADLFFEHTLSNSLGLQDGQVNAASAAVDYGVGIRVVAGDQTGYAYVESTARGDLLKAARTAAQIAESAPRLPAGALGVKVPACDLYAAKQRWEDASVSWKMPFVQRLNDRIFALDARVSKVTVSLADSTSRVLFVDSEGARACDERPLASLSATCVMLANGVYENGRASRSFRMGAEFLTDALVEELAQDAVNETAVLFKAVKPTGGEMPVVLGAGKSGIFLHEAIGHAFEADFNRKNVSIFSDLLHKKVCGSFVNVVDDGTVPANRGAVNIDDEGGAGQRTYIVREGVLASYLHDRISARHYGVAPTGNGRRQSFRHAPMPRMRATYMENGRASEADLIAAVQRGVFVNSFANGQVQIGAGDFTFYVKSGYLIEGGRLTQPIKDINIIGNGPRALADIEMVADNARIDNGTWTCGKDGQSCPVTCGMPSALVRKLTVGGLS